MNKKPYEAPSIAVVGLRNALMDGFPVHWSQENSGDIEARPNTIFEDEDMGGSPTGNPNLWEDEEEDF